ncbi:MAG TPA: hypothetical protein VLL52_00805 [Anaerolineae bacterium]|nr:hypothetical protein [Anaerolineae bacterium]
MSTLSNNAFNFANSLFRQRKPQVLHEYAATVAKKIGGEGQKQVPDFKSVHQYQGKGTNHCGPTSLSMIINMSLMEKGYRGDVVRYEAMQEAMMNGSLGFGLTGYRLKKGGLLQHVEVVEDITGATLPWGLVQAFNDFNEGFMAAGGPNLGTPHLREEGSKQDLLDNIKNGYKTVIMLVWANGGAHWVIVVDYDADKDAFILLDPAHEKGGSTRVGWAKLAENWNRPIGVTNLPDLPFIDEERFEDMLTLENVMVTFKPA